MNRISVFRWLLTTFSFTKMRISLQFIIIFSILLGFTVSLVNSKIYTIQVDEVNMLNSSYVEGYYNFSKFAVTKFNRSTFVMNIEFELLTDLYDGDYSFDSVYYMKKRPGLSWSKNLYYWPKQSPCMGIGTFRQFARKDFNDTNVPLYEKDKKCLIPKVKWSFANKSNNFYLIWILFVDTGPLLCSQFCFRSCLSAIVSSTWLLESWI